MHLSLISRRFVFGLAAVGLVLIATLVTTITVLTFRVWRAADYPGAELVSEQTRTQFFPMQVRQTAAYKSQAPFPDVYDWYSRGFRLGPEQYAQSNCILIADTTTHWVLVFDMSVTLCDTSEGTLMFVSRTILLRWR